VNVIRLGKFSLAGLALLAAQPALSQEYPVKTVRIVTAEAGGGSDLPARVLADALRPRLGQPFVIDNRSGTIAGEVVSKAAPDGYTLLFYGNSLWILPLIREKSMLNYDLADLVPLTMAIMTPTLLTVHPSLQVSSVKELIALAKTKPGMLDYASASVGSGNHMAAELFNYLADVKLRRIAHKGYMTAMISTLVGETQIFFPIAGSGMEQIRAGKLKGLGVTTEKPTPLAPGLRPVAEVLPGYNSVFRTGAFAPKGTPQPIVDRLSREMIQALQRDDIQKKLFAMGMEVIAASPQETAAEIRKETALMTKVIAKANIKEQ
jgi:tripartite-type tricarboxylate transporter receptor subunit TctC